MIASLAFSIVAAGLVFLAGRKDAPRDPKTYASVLCDIASHGSPSPLAPAMAETGSLESRVRRMLRPPGVHAGKTLALLGVLTACSLSMIGQENPQSAEIPAAEVGLRWTANLFPAEP